MDALSHGFVDFIRNDIAGAHGFGGQMGSFGSKSDRFGSSPKIIPYCREIDLRLAVVDEVSGEQESCVLNILIHSRGDANRSRCKVMSELSSGAHLQMVTRLAQALRSQR